ncbi:MAG TPA: GYD domain-containing protein [Albidovulum sp.]|uniref:GYD domain-containing protein n=1 Tax=Albidovulum sp. TaxID=1872424 RepID=UPI002C1A5981|nr:GYD domain-containing protein [Albidovulum sp.]
MAKYIVTGCYTPAAMKGMIANPTDRETATAAVIAAAGGKLESYHLTTGESDFIIRVRTDDIVMLLASLIAVGATGAVSNFKTVQCFTSAEFLQAQKAAGAIATKYSAPS